MMKSTQVASQTGNEKSKSVDIAKAVDGLWAALLQGSASGMIEQAAKPTAAHSR